MADKLIQKHSQAQVENLKKYNRGIRIGPSAEYPRASSFVTNDLEKDTHMLLKKELITNPANATTPFGQMTAGKEDVDYFKEKKDYQRALQDIHLYMGSFDATDPGQHRIAEEIAPEIFATIDEQMSLEADYQKRIGQIEIHGMRTYDDFVLLMQLLRGELMIPNGPIYASKDVENVDAAYTRGLFNPKRYFPPNTNQAIEAKITAIKAGNPTIAAILTRMHNNMKDATKGFNKTTAPSILLPSTSSVQHMFSGTPTADPLLDLAAAEKPYPRVQP